MLPRRNLRCDRFSAGRGEQHERGGRGRDPRRRRPQLVSEAEEPDRDRGAAGPEVEGEVERPGDRAALRRGRCGLHGSGGTAVGQPVPGTGRDGRDQRDRRRVPAGQGQHHEAGEQRGEPVQLRSPRAEAGHQRLGQQRADQDRAEHAARQRQVGVPRAVEQRRDQREEQADRGPGEEAGRGREAEDRPHPGRDPRRVEPPPAARCGGPGQGRCAAWLGGSA